ncbi:MAG: GreA/GreB family elongation factor [Syntrophobacteraceae bacterium]
MKKKIPISRNGYHRLIKELIHLRRVVRPEVLDDLREARGYGVKIENQQYLFARERHVTLQKKINDLKEKLERCEIVVGRKFFFKQVGFGTKIIIKNMDSGETNQYQMVGPWESDISDGKLSVESPVGREMMGHCEGDEVVVITPSGTRTFQVVSIEI